MRPPLWHPPIELSTAEHAILTRIRRAEVCVFLRQHRHALFADALQQELLTLYKDQPQGQPSVPLVQLALATLLQAYTQVSDDEVIEATTMDPRWQVVLDCLDAEMPSARHPSGLSSALARAVHGQTPAGTHRGERCYQGCLWASTIADGVG